MSLRIEFRAEARAEFDEACDWYERQRKGLGADFTACVQETLDQISVSPEAHSPVFKDIRRAIVRRFPYSVFYRPEPERIVVLGVFHAKRDPKLWKKRS